MRFAYHWISWENTHANVDQISQEMDSAVPLIVKIAKVSFYLVRWQRRFSAHFQTTMMEFFAKLLTVFTKLSMVDVYQGSKYSSRWIILSKYLKLKHFLNKFKNYLVIDREIWESIIFDKQGRKKI